MKRIVVIITCCLLFLQPAVMMNVHANEETPDFQHYLKSYLTDVGMYEVANINQPMLHQYIYSYFLEEGAAFDTATAIVNISDDLGLAIRGKTDLYEEILFEIYFAVFCHWNIC